MTRRHLPLRRTLGSDSVSLQTPGSDVDMGLMLGLKQLHALILRAAAGDSGAQIERDTLAHQVDWVLLQMRDARCTRQTV